MGNTPDPLDIPPFLVRDANNQSEFMKMAHSSVAEESRPAKSVKPNGVAKPPVKAAGKAKAKPAAKAAPKAEKAPKAPAKAAKAPAKAKVTKPKAESVEKDAYGFRKGTAKSKAVALYARKNGATLEEVKAAVGSVQLNVLNALEAEGHAVERNKEQREGQRPVTRYILKAKK